MTKSFVTKIHALSSGDCVVLEELEGVGGTLRVTQYEQYRWLQIDDDNLQSLIDITEPARLLSPTSVFMLMGSVFAPAPVRVLNLGLGGGAIERSVRAHYPDWVVESVEQDVRVVEVARHYFFLPDSQVVHTQKAEDFMSNCSDSFDVVLVDLFYEGESAACVSRSDFFKHIERCLSPGGVCVMNLLYSDQSALVHTLKAARAYLPVTWLVDVKGHQNVMAYFMRERLSSDADLRSAGERFLDAHDTDGVVADWELVALPNRV